MGEEVDYSLITVSYVHLMGEERRGEEEYFEWVEIGS